MEWQPSENGGPPKFVEIPGSERVGGGGRGGGCRKAGQSGPDDCPCALGWRCHPAAKHGSCASLPCGSQLQLSHPAYLTPPPPPPCCQVIEADLVLLAMGFLGPEATLAEALGACCLTTSLLRAALRRAALS